MRILSFGNVGNFQTGYKDGIVVLTRLRGLLTTSVFQVSYDLQMKTWHNSSTLFLYTCFPEGLGKTLKNLNAMKKLLLLLLMAICICFSSCATNRTYIHDYGEKIQKVKKLFPEIYELYRNGSIIIDQVYITHKDNVVHIKYHYL